METISEFYGPFWAACFGFFLCKLWYKISERAKNDYWNGVDRELQNMIVKYEEKHGIKVSVTYNNDGSGDLWNVDHDHSMFLMFHFGSIEMLKERILASLDKY